MNLTVLLSRGVYPILLNFKILGCYIRIRINQLLIILINNNNSNTRVIATLLGCDIVLFHLKTGAKLSNPGKVMMMTVSTLATSKL